MHRPDDLRHRSPVKNHIEPQLVVRVKQTCYAYASEKEGYLHVPN